MDDFTTQEPVIVADPSKTVKLALEKLEQELAPMLSNFLTDNDSEAYLRMQESVEAFFSDQWVAHVLHDVTVEHIPGNGWLVTVGIDYDLTEDLNDLNAVDFMLEVSVIDDIDVLLASTEDDMTVSDPPATVDDAAVSNSIDDILFSPVKKEKPVKDESVTDWADFDYGC